MAYSDIHLPLPGFIALDWTLMTLALIPILIRISVRTRNRGLNSIASTIADVFVLLAWLSGAVLISINTWKNNLRMKYLSADPSTLYYGVPEHLSGHLLYVSWISLFFIYISLWAAKAAFLAFYYSIFSLQGRTARIGLFVACIFTASTFLLHMCLIAFWCSPISSNWAPEPGKHLCSAVHSIQSVTISTFTNIATDLVILSIPISTLVHTKLGRQERAGLVFVFLMGSVSILAALVRFICLKLIQNTPKASITHTIDVWALVEIVSSILAVCLPSLRKFVRKHQQPRSYHHQQRYSCGSGSLGALRLGSGRASTSRVYSPGMSLGSESGSVLKFEGANDEVRKSVPQIEELYFEGEDTIGIAVSVDEPVREKVGGPVDRYC